MQNKLSGQSHLKYKYRKILELSFLSVLFVIILFFYSFKEFNRKTEYIPKNNGFISVVDIPMTKQYKKPLRPHHPYIPVPGERIETLTNIPIDSIFKYDQNPLPPPPEPGNEIFDFIAVQEKPKLINMVRPHYPAIARKSGIDGTVVVNVLIDTNGNVEKAEILKSIPALDKAALEAAKQCRFKSGKQRDKYVKVWMSIPFKFKLK